MKVPQWPTLLVVILLLMLAGCSPTPGSPASTGAESAPAADGPATLRIGWAGSPDTINPGTAVLTEAYTIFELVYDSMYQLELDGSYSLELATDVTVSDDGTVWTFTIRDDAVWHDGEPLTAGDIAFSYNFYKNGEGFPYMTGYTGYFDTVEAPDDSTVVITLTDAIPNMESQLIYLYVLPEHIWSQLEGSAGVDFENTEMIGSGPFQLAEYEQNQFVRLTANPDYFGQVPKVGEIVFQTFSNQDALVQALRTAQVDMITEMPKTAVPALRNDETIEVVSGPPAAPSVADIMFNVADPENCPEDGLCNGHPALRDRTVRQALAHATDKQQIIEVTLLGFGTPGLTLLPDSMGVWYNDSLQDYAYDLAAANALLDEAGYLDGDGDGVREMPDGGNPLILRVNWPSDSTWAQRAAELLSQTWGQIGVKAELQTLDPDALTAICCPVYDYDVILWGWGSDPDPSFLLSVMTSKEVPTGSNETGYANPAYDELFAQQAITLDAEKRREIIWEMQRIVHEDVVYIIPFYDQSVQAYRTDRFTGWITNAGKLELTDPSSLLIVEPVQE